MPWCWICSIQNGAVGAAVPPVTGAEQDVPKAETRDSELREHMPRAVRSGTKALCKDGTCITARTMSNSESKRTASGTSVLVASR